MLNGLKMPKIARLKSSVMGISRVRWNAALIWTSSYVANLGVACKTPLLLIFYWVYHLLQLMMFFAATRPPLHIPDQPVLPFPLPNAIMFCLDTSASGGDAHVSYGLSFRLVFYSRDGVTTSTDSIDANPSFGDCSEPAAAIREALMEVRLIVD